MRVFVKTTRVLGLAEHELDALADMVREAKDTGKAERQMSSTEVLAIHVSNEYKRIPRHGMEESSRNVKKPG